MVYRSGISYLIGIDEMARLLGAMRSLFCVSKDGYFFSESSTVEMEVEFPVPKGMSVKKLAGEAAVVFYGFYIRYSGDGLALRTPPHDAEDDVEAYLPDILRWMYGKGGRAVRISLMLRSNYGPDGMEVHFEGTLTREGDFLYGRFETYGVDRDVLEAALEGGSEEVDKGIIERAQIPEEYLRKNPFFTRALSHLSRKAGAAAVTGA